MPLLAETPWSTCPVTVIVPETPPSAVCAEMLALDADVEAGEAEGDGLVHGRVEAQVRLLGVLGGADAVSTGGDGGEKAEGDESDDRC